ncbi:MAG: DUF4252 domain-containing protein [Prevotellaceae bacterium]|jgi:mannitol-1-phosphate/altronate dehydrogenase|nr:DUF4252 domain-containing protein [Prevotellaceae bacterium]
MKKITILAVTLLMMAITAQAQEIGKLLNRYSNDERFTYVSLNGNLIQFGLSFIDADMDGIDKTLKDELNEIKGIKVLTLESKSAEEKKQIEAIMTELNSAISKDSKAESVIETRKDGEVTKIYTTSEGLLIISKEPEELSVVFFSGKLSAKSIKELISIHDKKQF